MKTKHTKGPWTITNYSDTVCIQNIREMPMKNGTITETVFEITQGIIPNTANINLIAAAPEMFLILQEYLEKYMDIDETDLNNRAVSILKKARGE